MNKILTIFISMLFLTCNAMDIEHQKPHKPTLKEQKQFEKMLDERLQLTQEQKSIMKANRQKHIKEMEKTISKMENLHTKIKNVYLLGIPKYQADLRTAPYKAELALLKQNAQKQKYENRKNFENILTKEQKIEFEKIKKEHAKNRPPKPPID
ncbi:MAG: hypothetical protein IJ877_07630 [Candidatus Gastranaerophilales bacterium]|nr:hypothetical protein [Candidatus Gastranaerophilales bacterium]